ncbi:hypothetical protein CCACVL1_11820 [Corchorus capsularis]|uniref:Avr9/Cf-9 rapidly elicited protein n=1 Tax=Corchorus capsularis TaxID=210143 RepID=A0A1R3IJD6_COCAP|nr:hypothetical protein CCACVL1_11820 [Corchorus capsularis]
MEVEASPAAKKLRDIVRIVLFMISKSKIMVDFHFMLKKGKYNAGKAISNLGFHHKVHDHLSALSCKSSDAHLSFISPREYEFSCSNSPAFFHHHHHKRKHHHHNHHYSYYSNGGGRHLFGSSKSSSKNHYDDVTTVAALQKLLELLHNDTAAAAAVEASPMVYLPGFGRSPMGRQLRVTDSPYPLKDEGDSQVDMAAEEFIKKFRHKLDFEKRSMAAL